MGAPVQRENLMDPVLRIRPFPKNRSTRFMAGGRSASHRPGMPDFAHPQQGMVQDGPDSCSQRGALRLTPWPMCAKKVYNRVVLIIRVPPTLSEIEERSPLR